MKMNFLKSVTTGIIGLTLLSGCNHFGKKNDANKCSTNKCSGKKNEANHCKGKKDTNHCKGKKDSNSCTGKKDADSSKK